MVPYNLGYSMREAGHHFSRNWSTSLGAVVTIFLSLFIIGLFAITSLMVNNVVGDVESRITIQAFLADDADTALVTSLQEEAKGYDGVADVTYKSKDEALEEYRTTMVSENAQDAVALVYDSSACYLAGKDGSLKRLGVSNYRVPERDSLGKTRKIDPEEIETAEVAAIDVLDVGQSAVMRASLASLAVSFVTQDPPSNMCWAACVACIGNYLRGGSRTAVSVAKGYYGSSNYDRPLTNTLIPAVLATNGVSGYFHGSWPSDSLVSKNIGQGYPLVGIMSVNGNTTDTHAVVVRGYVAMSQIYVMDPEFGFTTAAKFGSSYAYTSAYLGAMLRTSEVVRRL